MIAPGRAGEAKSPQGAFAAREGLEKTGVPTTGRRRRPPIVGRTMLDVSDAHFAIINLNPTPLRRQLRPCGLLPCRKDVGLLLHRGFAADQHFVNALCPNK